MTVLILIAMGCGPVPLPAPPSPRQVGLDPAASSERVGVPIACGGGGSGGYRKPARPGHQHQQQLPAQPTPDQQTPDVSEKT